MAHCVQVQGVQVKRWVLSHGARERVELSPKEVWRGLS